MGLRLEARRALVLGLGWIGDDVRPSGCMDMERAGELLLMLGRVVVVVVVERDVEWE